jgi:methyl-accepting chemotaxis protein
MSLFRFGKRKRNQPLAQNSDAAAVSPELLSSIADLRQGMAAIRGTLRGVDSGAAEAMAACDRMFSAIEQQARHSADAADSTRLLEDVVVRFRSSIVQQHSAVEESDKGMDEAATEITVIANSAEKLAASAAESAKNAEIGREAMRETVDSIARIRSQVIISMDKNRALDDSRRQIGQIVDTLRTITRQTGLLALNAAVECSRSGEAGRAFGVISAEIGKLADAAANATVEIEVLIAGVQTGVDGAIKAMEASNVAAEDGERLSKDAGSAIFLMIDSVNSVQSEVKTVASTATGLREVVNAARDKVAAVREMDTVVTDVVSEMIAIAERTVGSISKIAAGVEQTAVDTEEISIFAAKLPSITQEIASSLDDIAADLEKLETGGGSDDYQLEERAQTDIARKSAA